MVCGRHRGDRTEDNTVILRFVHRTATTTYVALSSSTLLRRNSLMALGRMRIEA
jgi:hypothetical protein